MNSSPTHVSSPFMFYLLELSASTFKVPQEQRINPYNNNNINYKKICLFIYFIKRAVSLYVCLFHNPSVIREIKYLQI